MGNREETSFVRTCFNVLNALSGIGLITIPYTLSEAGWLSLVYLVTMAILTCYTAVLMKRCMETNSRINSYPDIGNLAFGRRGRVIISIFIYLQLYLVPIGLLILETDNLHALFPDAGFQIGALPIRGRTFFAIITGLLILPSMYLEDLNFLSFVSATGVLSSVVIIFCVFCVGAFNGIGFSQSGDLFRLSGVPTSLSLYAFCFGAHPIFPTIYSSMRNKTEFSKVLLISFALSCVGYISMGIFGYMMFGDEVQSQVTLNLPTSKLSSKIAIYTTLIGPVAKYALIMSPIINAIEGHLPNLHRRRLICILIRTLVLLSTVLVALFFPYFGSLMSLVGAILDVTVCILFPCICYLRISNFQWGFESVIIVLIVALGACLGCLGTYSSVRDLIAHV